MPQVILHHMATEHRLPLILQSGKGQESGQVDAEAGRAGVMLMNSAFGFLGFRRRHVFPANLSSVDGMHRVRSVAQRHWHESVAGRHRVALRHHPCASVTLRACRSSAPWGRPHPCASPETPDFPSVENESMAVGSMDRWSS